MLKEKAGIYVREHVLGQRPNVNIETHGGLQSSWDDKKEMFLRGVEWAERTLRPHDMDDAEGGIATGYYCRDCGSFIDDPACHTTGCPRSGTG